MEGYWLFYIKHEFIDRFISNKNYFTINPK